MNAGAFCSGALLIASLGLAGCATVPPQVGESPPVVADSKREATYQQILAHSSDRAEVYDGFDTRMFSAMTAQTLEFRRARLERLAWFQSIPPPELERRWAEEQAEHAQFIDFFFGAFVNIPRFDDFDRKDSIWRIALVSGGNELTPSSVVRIGRADLNLRALYPYLGEFWVAYRVRFPRADATGKAVVAPGAQKVLVRVASTLGKAEFELPLAESVNAPVVP